jgi:hypothetical protein
MTGSISRPLLGTLRILGGSALCTDFRRGFYTSLLGKNAVSPAIRTEKREIQRIHQTAIQCLAGWNGASK